MLPTRRFGVLAAVAVLFVAGAVGPAAAAQDGSVVADPTDPGATATHTVTVTVEATEPLNGVEVDYGAAGAVLGDVDASDVATVGIDRGDDGPSVDVEAGMGVQSVDVSDDGTTLTLSLGGTHELDAGDEVVVVVEGVANPEAGEYDVALRVNPQSSGGEATATLAVGSGMNGTMDGSMNETMGETEMADETTTDAVMDEEMDETNGDGTGATAPGFGPTVAVVGLLTVALLALRRHRR